MKRLVRLLTAVLLSILITGNPWELNVTPSVYAAQDQHSTGLASRQPVLEDGTPVKLRLSQTVSSADAHVDERVEFEVLEEIKVADATVIPKGGIAWGTVTEAQPKRRMARGGKLEIVMDSVRLIDGEKAALRATKEVKGGGHTGAMTAGIVATGLLLWPAAPFFLFMHGKDITIPKGTELPTFVNGNFPLELAKFQQGTPVTPQTQVAAIRSTSTATAGTQIQAATNVEVEVASIPSGADIELDGSFVGSTPSTIGVPGGEHVISVKKNGYKPWERKIKTSTGKVSIAADLEADVKREQKTEAAAPGQASAEFAPVHETAGAARAETLGTLSLTSSPYGAEIYADSLFVGKTPATLRLKPGYHEILVLMKDYRNWFREIKTDAGAKLDLTAALEKSN